MSRKYNFIIVALILHAVIVSIVLFWADYLDFLNIPSVIRPVMLSKTTNFEENNFHPIVHDNLLIFSIRVNEITNSLNDTIRRTNPDLPPIKFSNKNLSYKSPDQSWITITNDLILITLYRDVAAVLNSSEVQAMAVHELCHVVLGHIDSSPLTRRRETDKEKRADMCAISFGIDSYVLISAIAKLASEGEERSERITALTY